MLDRIRANSRDPRWWLWGNSKQAPTVNGRTVALAGVALVVGAIFLLVSLFSGSPIKRPVFVAQTTPPSASQSVASSAAHASSSGNNGSSSSSSASLPVVVQQVLEQGAAAEVNGDWAGVATAAGVAPPPPVGQIGQPATVQSISITPELQSGQLQAATGTATVDQGTTPYVVQVEAQLYNSQWVFIPQQGGVAQSSGG